MTPDNSCTVCGQNDGDTQLAEPHPTSWAAVARLMAQDDDSDFDWDQWKDQMRDREAIDNLYPNG